jgi:hypothetical protein
MVRIEENDKEFLGAAVAKKRVRALQLLAVGLLSFGVGFLGSFWTQASCHLLTATSSEGDLYYGMWRYSPSESAAEGSYCSLYSYTNDHDRPMVSRILGCIALAFGTFAVFVLWMYLISGQSKGSFWNGAIIAAVVAGIFQLATLLFVLDTNVCSSYTCRFGQASLVSALSGLSFFVLAYEMHYNTPIVNYNASEVETCPSYEKPSNLMRSMQLRDINASFLSYVRRMCGDDDREEDPAPTLNQYLRKKQPNILSPSIGRSNENDYKPPQIV